MFPFNLIASDLKYPERPKNWKWREGHPTDLLHTLTLYETDRMGWVVTTLHIRNPGRRSRADAQPRTYGVTADGRVCTVGLGPHVKRTLTVYVTRGRASALKPLLDLHEKGLADAGSIRDRRSSRMAAGSLRRMDDRWGF